MGILDWFMNRPSQFDPDRLSDEMTIQAMDKAVSLTNPRLKLLHSYQERLAPAVDISVRYLREMVLALPPSIEISEANWSSDPVLRAFFAAASDIPTALGRSHSLRTLFDKYPGLDEAHIILGMTYNEQRVLGMSLQGDVIQRDVAQTVLNFSAPRARMCGHTEEEVRRLLGAQSFEYLVAQAMSEIGEERSERQELADNRTLIRARLRLLQQQGPGLGSVFGAAPASTGEQLKLEAQLLENERQMEAIGSSQSALDAELECLREVLEHPGRYIRFERKQLRLSTLNVVLDETSTDVASDVVFSLAVLEGVPKVQRAFVMGRSARSELPDMKMNFDDAARYL
jgi:hypothetical protein